MYHRLVLATVIFSVSLYLNDSFGTRIVVHFIDILSSLGVDIAMFARLLGDHGISVPSSKTENSFHHFTIVFIHLVTHFTIDSGNATANCHALYAIFQPTVVTGVNAVSAKVDQNHQNHHFNHPIVLAFGHISDTDLKLE